MKDGLLSWRLKPWKAFSFGEGIHCFGGGCVEGGSVVLSYDFFVGLLSLHSSKIYRRLNNKFLHGLILTPAFHYNKPSKSILSWDPFFSDDKLETRYEMSCLFEFENFYHYLQSK